MRFGMPWPGRDVAREAEEAGVGAFCAGEFADHDAYLTVADIVANTEHALAGPAIAYAFARTPYAHATALRHLHAQAPGRLFLGLGSAAFRINRDWLGVPAERPVDRITETVGAVRAWLHAENGEGVHLLRRVLRPRRRRPCPGAGPAGHPGKWFLARPPSTPAWQ
ncbi:LLM class flavin-dependent oxidoreductase, partial [Streptomyces sp. NBC_00103]|uniref:LLM class flavin-dependent oxidoreductase n=1 Tax=Streptomyces sp. NBC_00103 TaxID=2975653 RepID=UPI00224D8863